MSFSETAVSAEVLENNRNLNDRNKRDTKHMKTLPAAGVLGD